MRVCVCACVCARKCVLSLDCVCDWASTHVSTHEAELVSDYMLARERERVCMCVLVGVCLYM